MKNFRIAGLLIALLILGSSFKNDTPEHADKVLATAVAKAKKEKKKVLIMFHASWCGWCKKMDASIADPEVKAFFDRNYVISHLVVLESKGKENLENPGGLEMLKKYNSEGFGLPTWFIFDGKGQLVGDSHMRPAGAGPDVKGENMGCPASEKEVAAFIEVLKKTSNMTAGELSIVAKVFRKNDPTYKPL